MTTWLTWFTALLTATGMLVYGVTRISTPPASGWIDHPPLDSDTLLANLVQELPRLKRPRDPNVSDAYSYRMLRDKPLPPDIADYLQQTRHLDETIIALAEQSPPRRAWPRPGKGGMAPYKYVPVRLMQHLALASEHAATEGDYRRSMELCRALFQLAEDPGRNRHSLTRRHWYVFAAPGVILQRHAIPSEDSVRFWDYLTQDEGLLVGRNLARVLHFNCDLSDTLDAVYTRDPNGNGWMVPSVIPPSFWDQEPLGRVWNLTSGLYPDRKTFEHTLLQTLSETRQVDELILPDVALWKMDFDPNGNQPLPYGMKLLPRIRRSFGLHEVTQAREQTRLRRETAIMLSLSNFKAVHGRYPDTLEELPFEVPLDLAESIWGEDCAYQYETDGQHYRLINQSLRAQRARHPRDRQLNPILPEALRGQRR